MIRSLSRLPAVVTAVMLLAAMPLTASAGHGHASRVCLTRPAHHLPLGSKATVVLFGIEGGNIRPWKVGFLSDGSIDATDIQARNQQLTDPKPTLNGLLKLADAEGLFTMQDRTLCPGVLPDIASRYIAFSTSAGTKKVSVHGSCLSGFNQLYAILQETADISR